MVNYFNTSKAETEANNVTLKCTRKEREAHLQDHWEISLQVQYSTLILVVCCHKNRFFFHSLFNTDTHMEIF